MKSPLRRRKVNRSNINKTQDDLSTSYHESIDEIQKVDDDLSNRRRKFATKIKC